MKKEVLLPAVYFAFASGIYILKPFGENNWIYEQTCYGLAALIAAISAFLALRTYGKGSRFISLFSFVLGLVSWVIADVLFSYLEFVKESLTFPSIADYFYLGGYIFLFAGLLFEARAADISWKKLSKRVYLAASTFTIVMFGLFTYFTLLGSYSPEASFWENVVTIGYTVGDLFLVIGSFFLIILAWEYRGGRASKVWIGLFLGFLVTMIADLLYATFTAEGLTGEGFFYIVPQTGYILGYMCMVYAFGSLRKILKEFQLRAFSSSSKKIQSTK